MRFGGRRDTLGWSILCFLALVCSWGKTGYAKDVPTQIFYFSDTHSQYDLASKFFHDFFQARHAFLDKNPHGECLIIHGGDIGGASEWSVDKGWLNYWILGRLAEYCEIVAVLGNHEALDFHDKTNANRLFVQQNEGLIRMVSGRRKRTFRVLSANLETTPKSRHLFAHHYDHELPSREKIRFVGLTLSRFFKTTTYKRALDPHIFEAFRDMTEVAWEQVQAAHRQGVQNMVFVVHDDHEVVKKLQAEISHRCQEEKIPMNFPLTLASHDHALVREELQSTGGILLDPASHYRLFFSVEMTGKATVRRIREFDTFQSGFARGKYGLEKTELEILEAIRKQLEHPKNKENRTVLGQTPGIAESKRVLRRGRELLGTAVADSLRYWALGFVRGLKRYRLHEVIAFFNTRSYRREIDIPEGDVTLGMMKSIYNMPTTARVAVVTGAQVQRLYDSLHQKEKSEGVYNPQMSSNLRVNVRNLLEIRTGKNHWQVLHPDKQYILALDGWLSQNGYAIDDWQMILGTGKRWVGGAELSTSEVFRRHLPERLTTKCIDELILLGSELQ